MFATTVASHAANKTTLPSGVAATVNGTPIPESVVRAFIGDDEQSSAGQGHADGNKTRQTVIDQMIDRILIEQECQKRGILPTDAQVRADEEKLIQTMSGEGAFHDFLKQSHFTREQYREYVLKTSAANSALLAEMAKNIAVSPEDIAEYSRSHSKAFHFPERLTGAQIFFDTRATFLRDQIKSSKHLNDGPELDRAVNDEITRRQQLAEETRRKAMEPGADFAGLARKYSDDVVTREKGGIVQVVKSSPHATALDAAFWRLQPGEVGPVVKTDRGFYVIKVLERKPAANQTLEEAAPAIRARLAQAKAGEALNAWLTQARAKADIVRSGQ